jgi:nucleotide-binding universal stress UspA family protein
MINFSNILYAIDLDANNISSVVYALEIARLFKCRIHILYVNDSQAGYRHPTDREDAVALKVKEILPTYLLENADIVYASSKGHTAEEILDYAQKNKIDLIIAGHKHHSKLFSIMFDSTDVNIVDKARMPVLVIPEK